MLGYTSNKKIVEEIFLNGYLKDMFTQKFKLTQEEAINELTNPEKKLVNYLEEIYNEILSSKLKLSSEPNLNRKSKKEKRLSIKEITARASKRGYQNDIDQAMIQVNDLENLVAKLQRRGKKEQLTDMECRKIISVVKIAKQTLEPIIKNSKFRKKNLEL